MSSKIVLSPPLPRSITDIAFAMVPPGFEMVALDRAAPGFARAMAEAEFYVGFARGEFGDAFFRGAPRLRLIQLISAGYDRIDLDAARRARVPVANNGGANAVAVAEHTLMLILAVLKRLTAHHANVVAGRWRVGDFVEMRVHELADKTVGIVGLGAIGKKVARRLRAFDVRIVYYDIVRLTGDEEDALAVRFALLDELLRESDVVSLHVPLTPVTRGMIGARELGLMKPTAVLVNTCRGPVVDEPALADALKRGRIAGAGLDVLVGEPPPSANPLLALEDVTLTPHIAGPTWETWPRAFRNAFDNIQRVAAGRRPLWVVPELRDLG